jgi:Flp pilus assembly pilin Flp
MLILMKKLLRHEQAQDLAEYGVALAVIGAGAGIAAIALAADVNTIWSACQSILDKAATSV